MAENGKKNNNQLKPPPPQTVPGVVLYHCDPEIDDRIRDVQRLREAGHDLDTIGLAIKRGRAQTCVYLRQIRMARRAYIEAFPEEFDSGLDSLHAAIVERKDLDALLRRELTALQDTPNPSNRVGVYKLIMRNMRELEELAGLFVRRIEHGGELTVKDDIRTVLDNAPEGAREAYLDALSAVVAAAEHSIQIQQPDTD